MAFKKIITYQCNKCRRLKDFTSSDLHAFINLCTITKNCEGRLSPIATKNLRNVLASTPIDGIPDWNSRFDPSVSVQDNNEQVVYYDLASSSSFSLTLALRKGSVLVLPSDFTLRFAMQSMSNLVYNEFTYYMTSTFSQVTGPDTSPSAKVLRFTASDTIVVYRNGVELSEGTGPNDYQLMYNSTQLGYAIKFNTTSTISTLIKVFVYQAQSVELTTPLVFTKNALLVSSSDNKTAWSNALEVDIDGIEYVLYTCTDTSTLPTNMLLNIYPSNNQLSTDTSQLLEHYKFLVSYKPYTVADRIYEALVPMTNLIDTNTSIRMTYSTNDSSQYLEVSGTAVEYPTKPITILSFDSMDNELLYGIISSVSDQTVISNNVNIIGPVS
jgi:hypothetical protein